MYSKKMEKKIYIKCTKKKKKNIKMKKYKINFKIFFNKKMKKMEKIKKSKEKWKKWKKWKNETVKKIFWKTFLEKIEPRIWKKFFWFAEWSIRKLFINLNPKSSSVKIIKH